jgi:hypothetical protein
VDESRGRGDWLGHRGQAAAGRGRGEVGAEVREAEAGEEARVDDGVHR